MKLKFWSKTKEETTEQRKIERLERLVERLGRDVDHLQRAAFLRPTTDRRGRHYPGYLASEVIEQLMTHLNIDLQTTPAVPSKTILAFRPSTNPEG